MTRNKILFSLLAIIGLSFLISGSASAAINTDIKVADKEFEYAVSPAYIYFEITPSETTENTLRLRNTGKSEIDIMIGVSPLTITDESYLSSNLTDFTTRTEVVRWTTLALESGCKATNTDADGNIFVHLRVQEECFVSVEVKTPKNAPSGAQHMNVFFQLYEDDVDASDSVKTIQSIGIHAYAQNKTGDANACVEVKRQKIPFWVFSGALNTDYLAENCGNLDVYVESYLEVENLMGNTVYKSYVEDGDEWKITDESQKNLVLTDTSRLVNISWEEAGLGIFRVTQIVKTGNNSFEETRLVFLIPIWMLVAVLICLLIIIACIVGAVRKRKKIYSRK